MGSSNTQPVDVESGRASCYNNPLPGSQDEEVVKDKSDSKQLTPPFPSAASTNGRSTSTGIGDNGRITATLHDNRNHSRCLSSANRTDLNVDQLPESTKRSSNFLSIAKKSGRIIVRVMILTSIVTAVAGAIWYYMGFVFLVKAFIIGAIVYIASGGGGGFRYLQIVCKTLPRDVKALLSYLRFQICVYYLKRYNYGIKDMFNKIVQKNPDKVLLVLDEEKWTASQIEDYSNRVANVFRNMGLKKGDVVAIMLENKPEYVCIWLGLSKIGVVTALINFNLRMAPLAHCVNISKCSVLIYEDTFLSAVKDSKHLMESVKLFCWHRKGAQLPEEDWVKSIVLPITESNNAIIPETEKAGFHDLLLYIYTSGTTGLPKAAVISTSRAIFLTGALRYQMGWTENDKFYTPLPMYHTAGGITCIGQAIMFGSCVVIRKKFSASAYFPDIAKHEATVAQYIGEMCRYVLATPHCPEDTQHKLKMVFGNGLRPQIWREFVTRFNIPRVGEFYGATEGNANIVNVDNKEGAIGFISRILPAVYPISIIKVDAYGEPIRNEKGLCIKCKPGEPGVFIGKISANPARAFLGYVNEKESEKKIVRDVFRKGDSAFISGDIVEFDELGYLYFKDRTGDTFRWKGENVSTAEVEAIVSNIAGYRDCVVYGVEVPGAEGRAGMAAIVDEARTLDLKSLAKGIKEQLPPYARPLFLRIMNEVEMTGTYKLKKLDLQKEGIDPNVIKDQLYYMNVRGEYEMLTPPVYADIHNCKIRF